MDIPDVECEEMLEISDKEPGHSVDRGHKLLGDLGGPTGPSLGHF